MMLRPHDRRISLAPKLTFFSISCPKAKPKPPINRYTMPTNAAMAIHKTNTNVIMSK